MTGQHRYKLFILMTLGILLLGAAGLSACSQAAPTAPATPTPPASAPAGGATTPPPTEQVPPSLQPIPQKPPAVQVNLAAFAFSQATITVPVGTQVIWTNKDSVTHTVTSNGNLFDSGNLAQGGTFSYTFKEKGTFQYRCGLHPSMTGKIIVVEGNAAPTSGTTAPSTIGTTSPPTTGTTTPPATGTTTPPPAGGTTPSGGSAGTDYNY